MNNAGMGRWMAALALAAAAEASATVLVYVPVNPAFGGNPLNGPTLFNTAQAANKHKDPASSSALLNKTPLQQFNDMLQRSLLGQLATATVGGILGSGGKLKPGSVETGDFRIDIVDAGGGVLIITTTDKSTGETTSFQVGGQ
ncbi:MAG: curli assembly protein CsgF [Pseudomonadota bacterium]|nr:curli assembly protein CsgF [Pseudomonadota bacterium]